MPSPSPDSGAETGPRHHATADDGGTDASTPGAVAGALGDVGSDHDAAGFLAALEPAAVEIWPRPLVVNGSPVLAVATISARGGAPSHPPTRVRWSLWRSEDSAPPVAQGTTSWAAAAPTTAPIVFSVTTPGAHRLVSEVEVDGVGSRRLEVPVAVRRPTVDATRALTDDELVAQRSQLGEQVALTPDPAQRRTALEGHDAAEWIAHERGLSRPPPPATDAAPGASGVTWWVPDEPVAMRAFIEHHIGEKGRERGVGHVRSLLHSAFTQATPEQVRLGEAQLALAEGDARDFEARLRDQVWRAAHDLLDQSSRAIDGVLQSYGLTTGHARINEAARAIAEDEDQVDTWVATLVRGSRDVPDHAGRYRGGEAAREDLSLAARELTAQQESIRALQQQRIDVMRQRQVDRREHAGHHGAGPSSDAERVREIERALQRLPAPASSPGLRMPTAAPAATPEERLAAIDARLRAAEIEYRTRWMEAERAHPMLASFRSGRGGADAANLGGLTGGGDDAMRAALRATLPRLGNIARTKGALVGGKLDPLALPPVVELAKQRMHVPPGSLRDGVARDVAREAASGGAQDWAVAAVTFGLVLLTIVPTGGGSAVMLAELGGLALDLYLGLDAYADYTVQSAAADTSMDRAQALAAEEPSLAWLAIQLFMTGLSAGLVTQTFRQASNLRRAAETGQAVQDAVRQLDAIGESHGIGRIGTRVLEDVPPSAPTLAGADPAAPGAAMARTLPGETAAAVRRGVYADRFGGVAADDADALARRLGVGVQVDAALGSGVQIDRYVHGDGEVWIIGLRIGPGAATADVLAHQPTMAFMRRYNGLLGRLQRLLASPPVPGSEAWTAWLETEKLSRLVAQRQAAMTGLPPGDVAAEIEREIAELQGRLAEYEPGLQRRGAEAGAQVDAVGSVGSPDLSGSGRARAVPASIERIASETPPLQRQVDGVTRVEKGPAYEGAMQDLRRMYSQMESEAQSVVAVRGQRTDGASRWSYGHDARELSHGVTAVEVRIRLDGAVNAIPPDEMLRLRQNIVAGVDRYYNFQHDVRAAGGEVSRLHVEICFVDDPSSAHLNVTVQRGEGYADLKNWFVDGAPTTHAHEIGHGGFGLWDEYVDERNPWRASATAPMVREDSSLMGNYWVGGQPFGPVVPETSLKGRHLDEISGDIADRRVPPHASSEGADTALHGTASALRGGADDAMSGGRHGVDPDNGVELLTDPHPPPEVAAMQSKLAGAQNEMMARLDGGRAFRSLVAEMLRRKEAEVDAVAHYLASAGYADMKRDDLAIVFDYLFQSNGIRLDYVNYAAWRRISCGIGTVDDVRFVVHELAEQRALQDSGFADTLGRAVTGEHSEREWRRAFGEAYEPAHGEALAVEARFVADEVARRTRGALRLSPEEAAMSDPLRADEMRSYMRVDGVSLEAHPSAHQWTRRDERIELSAEVAADLQIRQDPTIGEVILAVKRSSM